MYLYNTCLNSETLTLSDTVCSGFVVSTGSVLSSSKCYSALLKNVRTQNETNTKADLYSIVSFITIVIFSQL